jgi:response regulator RpfG family c-di-GMP phosphodiesterase
MEECLEYFLQEVKMPEFQDPESGTLANSTLIRAHLERFLEIEKPEQYLHSVRTAIRTDLTLLSEAITDQKTRRSMALGSTLHDIGRLKHSETLGKTNLTPEDWEKIRQHPEITAQVLLSYDPLAASIAEQHHQNQKTNPYPLELKIPPVPNSKALSIILAINDFYDRASVTQNGRIPRTKLERAVDNLLREERPSSWRIKRELKRTYNEKRVIYGTEETKVLCMGSEIIKRNYEQGIFGNPNPIAPFTVEQLATLYKHIKTKN